MLAQSIQTIEKPNETKANGSAHNGQSVSLIQMLPPLENGDRLSRAEFARRYTAHPEIKKAELVEGVVYMASPVRAQQHGIPHSSINGLFMLYCAATPGLRMADNSTLRLDHDNELQPDVAVWLDESLGGRTRITADDYLAGTPELIVEIAASSVAYDLGTNLNAYRRNGVAEYVVLIPYEQSVRWLAWVDGEYHELLPDEQGIIRSRIFPGLWFSPAHFWANDLPGLVACLQQGLAAN